MPDARDRTPHWCGMLTRSNTQRSVAFEHTVTAMAMFVQIKPTMVNTCLWHRDPCFMPRQDHAHAAVVVRCQGAASSCDNQRQLVHDASVIS
jgi:hypothetical protein